MPWSCRCSDMLSLLEIGAMAWFLSTQHSESLRHGFSTRLHSQTRWCLNNNTQLAGYVCTAAVKKQWNETGSDSFTSWFWLPGLGQWSRLWVSWEEDPQSSLGAQIYIALCLRLTRGADTRTGTCAVAMATPPGWSAFGVDVLYKSGMRELKIGAIWTSAGEKIRFTGHVSAALEDCAQQD